MITEKIKKSQCLAIIHQYEQLLKDMIDDEKRAIDRQSKIGESEFETAKKTIMAEGTKKGMERVMELIYHYAHKDV